MNWILLLGIAIVILTHLAMIISGYSLHAILNLSAAALIVYSTLPILF
jgi:hypothetical protein